MTAFLGDFFASASVGLSVVIVVVVTALLTAVAYLLNRKNIILKL